MLSADIGSQGRQWAVPNVGRLCGCWMSRVFHWRGEENSPPGRMHRRVGVAPPPLRELLVFFHAPAYCVSFLISLFIFQKHFLLLRVLEWLPQSQNGELKINFVLFLWGSGSQCHLLWNQTSFLSSFCCYDIICISLRINAFYNVAEAPVKWKLLIKMISLP